MGRRITPLDEPERIAERILNGQYDIETEQDFNDAFSDLFHTSSTGLTAKQKKLRTKAFNALPAGLRLLKRGEPIETPPKPRRKLITAGRIKGKIVYAEKTSVRVNNKLYTRYRDAKGRFVSVQHK